MTTVHTLLTSAAILAVAASACSPSGDEGAAEAAVAARSEQGVVHVRPGEDLHEAMRRARRSDEALVIELAPGRHPISNTISLPSNTRLTGAGSGVTIVTAAQPMDAMFANARPEGGDETVRVSGLTLDCSDRAQRALHMVRVADLALEHLELTGCQSEGVRISGHGQVTRGLTVTNVTARRNRGDGLIFMWATRNAQYVNVSAHFNGGRGVVFDHSEFQAANVSACDNGSDGVHLRNFFAADLNGLYACRNGRHGVFVEGMVASTGSGWIAQSNGRSNPGAFDEVHFSSRADLSYGVSRNSAVSGLVAGAYREGFGEPTARHGVFLAAAVSVEITGAHFEGLLSEPVCEACTE